MSGRAAIHCLGALLALTACQPQPRPEPPPDAAIGCAEDDGYAAPYDSGLIFWVGQFALAPSGDGLDIDGDGAVDAALNSAWSGLPREMINVAFRDALQADRMTALLEIAGVCADAYHGSDAASTVKLYVGRDSDDSRANNWCLGEGCGEVLVNPEYLDGDQATRRSTPAPIVDFVVHIVIQSVGSISFDADLGEPFELRRLHLRAVLVEDRTELRDGVLCGMVPASNLARIPIPLCTDNPAICEFYGIPTDRTLAEDLRINGHRPDIDFDGDGLETFDVGADGKVDICWDGDGSVMGSKDCMQDPQLQDGYSSCFAFHATPAIIVGLVP